ncbi:hypothetical protein IWX90DRAFT_280223 [Phyllosticta citrichinensis]|uniref:Uncharacterized protein n=1 Tax=Phyllosticta citrichinensis TaxID=1130410 RepID=A0ABR1XNL4_9PEZI
MRLWEVGPRKDAGAVHSKRRLTLAESKGKKTRTEEDSRTGNMPLPALLKTDLHAVGCSGLIPDITDQICDRRIDFQPRHLLVPLFGLSRTLTITPEHLERRRAPVWHVFCGEDGQLYLEWTSPPSKTTIPSALLPRNAMLAGYPSESSLPKTKAAISFAWSTRGELANGWQLDPLGCGIEGLQEATSIVTNATNSNRCQTKHTLPRIQPSADSVVLRLRLLAWTRVLPGREESIDKNSSPSRKYERFRLHKL